MTPIICSSDDSYDGNGKNEMVDDRKAQIKGFVGPRFDNKRRRRGDEDVLKEKIIKTCSNNFF